MPDAASHHMVPEWLDLVLNQGECVLTFCERGSDGDGMGRYGRSEGN